MELGMGRKDRTEEGMRMDTGETSQGRKIRGKPWRRGKERRGEGGGVSVGKMIDSATRNMIRTPSLARQSPSTPLNFFYL